MSNPNSPFGLSPVGHLSGAAWNGETMRCYLAAALGGAYFIGDPVVLAGSADTAGVAPTVSIATAGDASPIFGVITSFEPVAPGDHGNQNLQRIYRPASTAMYCNVCVDPTVLYEIQGDDDAVIAATDVGNLFLLTAGAGGNTLTGMSSWQIDSDTQATTSSQQVRLWSASSAPGNDISSLYAKWLVLINLNQLFSIGVNTVGSAWAGGVGV